MFSIPEYYNNHSAYQSLLFELIIVLRSGAWYVCTRIIHVVCVKGDIARNVAGITSSNGEVWE